MTEAAVKESKGRTILVVEDEPSMAVALKDGIAYEGFKVLHAEDGEKGLAFAREKNPDMIILDVMLPKMNGLDVCKTLRAENNEVPIIMLTARGQEIDKILGLKLGADDYITKPFSFMELLARIECIFRRMRRSTSNGPELTHTFGDITVDFERHEAQKQDKDLKMSPREFMLLEFFVRHRGKIVTRDELLDEVWGYETIPFTRTVDAHIAKLRKKIEDDPSDPRYLVTVHRMGYKFTG